MSLGQALQEEGASTRVPLKQGAGALMSSAGIIATQTAQINTLGTPSLEGKAEEESLPET